MYSSFRESTLSIVKQPKSSITFRYLSDARRERSSRCHLSFELKLDPPQACVIVASCVEAECDTDKKYCQHPHRLLEHKQTIKSKDGKELVVGKNGTEKEWYGIYANKYSADADGQIKIDLDLVSTSIADVTKSLKQRRDRQVDPFKKGFESKNFNLKKVKICFQAFSKSNDRDYKNPIGQIVSNEICDKKEETKYTIKRLSMCTCPADGGEELILLVSDAPKGMDVIFRDVDGWKGKGDIIETHKSAAMVLKVPPYKHTNITKNVEVDVYLQYREQNSESLSFRYCPNDELTTARGKKRKISRESSSDVSNKRAVLADSSSQSVPAVIQSDSIETNPSMTYSTGPPSHNKSLSSLQKGILEAFPQPELPDTSM